MKNKKFLSLVMALAMVFSMALPAFASTTATPAVENTDLTDMGKINTATTTVNGSYQAPILALTVPKKINLLLNPYGVSVKTNEDTAIEQTNVQRQIVSADNLIISRSNVGLSIKATATGTITSGTGGAWTLAKTKIDTTSTSASTKKEALVYMVFGTVNTTAIDTAEEVTAFMKTTKQGDDVPYAGLTFSDITYATVANDLANITFVDAATKKDGIIIQAGEGKETTMNQKLAECTVTEDENGDLVYGTVSAVAFMMDGKMVPNPKDASWGKDDKLTVSVAWKFVPDQQASTTTSA